MICVSIWMSILAFEELLRRVFGVEEKAGVEILGFLRGGRLRRAEEWADAAVAIFMGLGEAYAARIVR